MNRHHVTSLALVVATIGCNHDVRKVRRCADGPAQQEAKAKFVVECAEAANPMSDEEGEDLVRQCEETAKNIYSGRGTCRERFEVCPFTNGCYEHSWIACAESPLDSSSRAACRKFGWNPGSERNTR